MFVTAFLLALVPYSEAVNCVGCTSSQVCGSDGICYDISDLITCETEHYGYYCRKGQACCGITGGCIPAGMICCYPDHRYCEQNYTCCGSHICCVRDAVCIDGTCKLYNIWKKTNEDDKQPNTHDTEEIKETYPRSSLHSTTNVVTTHLTGKQSQILNTQHLVQGTTELYNSQNSKNPSSFKNNVSVLKWWYIALPVAVVACICVFVGLLFFIRRRARSKANCNNLDMVSGGKARVVGGSKNVDASQSDITTKENA